MKNGNSAEKIETKEPNLNAEGECKREALNGFRIVKVTAKTEGKNQGDIQLRTIHDPRGHKRGRGGGGTWLLSTVLSRYVQSL